MSYLPQSRIAAQAACLFATAAMVHLGVPNPAGAQELHVNAIMARQLQICDATIVGGRLRVSSRSVGRTSESSNQRPGIRESLKIDLTTDALSLAYEQTTDQVHFSYQVAAETGIRLLFQPLEQGTGDRIEFSQPTEGDLSLSVGEEPQLRVYQARSLWHLLISQPQVCREELLPKLRTMHATLDLALAADAVEESLFRLAEQRSADDTGDIAALVAQLADRRYAIREKAERELRRRGVDALSFLLAIDPRGLDAEQRFRVRRLLRAIAGNRGDDTPELAATRLVNEPHVWLAFLKSDEASKRVTAKAMLEDLLQAEIAFEPHAEAESRQSQWEAIAEMVAAAKSP